MRIPAAPAQSPPWLVHFLSANGLFLLGISHKRNRTVYALYLTSIMRYSRYEVTPGAVTGFIHFFSPGTWLYHILFKPEFLLWRRLALLWGSSPICLCATWLSLLGVWGVLKITELCSECILSIFRLSGRHGQAQLNSSVVGTHAGFHPQDKSTGRRASWMILLCNCPFFTPPPPPRAVH